MPKWIHIVTLLVGLSCTVIFAQDNNKIIGYAGLKGHITKAVSS